MIEGNRLLTAQELAQVLALPPASVRRLAREGQLRGVYRCGRLLRFSVDEVLEGMEQEASVDMQA